MGWIVEMCELAGVDPPRTFEEQVDASERIHTSLLMNTGAVFAGTDATDSVATMSVLTLARLGSDHRESTIANESLISKKAKEAQCIGFLCGCS